MNWDAASAELTKKLDPRHVKPPPQGKYGEYIEGWHAIGEANRIFGYGGWSYSADRIHLTNEEHNGGKHRIGYFAQVSVTVGDVTRSDVGHGQGFGKSLGDAHDSAVKEAVTDALKRALRTFGNPFGLALYDKTKANVGVEKEEFSSAKARDWMTGQINGAPNEKALREWWNGSKVSDLFKRLDEPHQNEVEAARDKRLLAFEPVDMPPAFQGGEDRLYG